VSAPSLTPGFGSHTQRPNWLFHTRLNAKEREVYTVLLSHTAVPDRRPAPGTKVAPGGLPRGRPTSCSSESGGRS
jgi:hypothetical protein